MIGYELATGAEQWFAAEMPAGCCASPVVADGILYFAGSSPPGTESPLPAFDTQLKQYDKNKDRRLSREEADNGVDGMFDSQDANGDGFVTREEYEQVRGYMLAGKNVAFALKPGGRGDVTGSHVLWKQDRGLPYVASGLVYLGQYVMVRDGGVVTAYDLTTGAELYRERVADVTSYLASPVAANGHIYLVGLEEGVVTVLKAGSKKPVVVASNPPLGGRLAATPAIADNTLYIRTADDLYAFAEN
jgi:outer membrane protein assembly factor BamB